MAGSTTRNRQILERRMAGETLASLASKYGLSTARVSQIALNEQRRVRRAQELAEADRLPQQPNALHLSPRLRRTLQGHFGKEDVSPLDVQNVGFDERAMYRIANFQRKYWHELVEWMDRAGFAPELGKESATHCCR